MKKLNGLKALRVRCAISQEQLASILCVDRSTVTKWETGAGYPRGETLTKLADVLGCTIDELYGRDPPGREGA